jgi:large repetitive protein
VTDTPPANLTPGDTLEYTIVLDVSDFFSLTQLTFTDQLGDGQTFDTSFTPTFDVRENGVATSGSSSLGTSYPVAAKDAKGQTAITLDLSRALTPYGTAAGWWTRRTDGW